MLSFIMKLSGSYQINLEKQKVWEALNNPDSQLSKSVMNQTNDAANKLPEEKTPESAKKVRMSKTAGPLVPSKILYS